MNKSNERGADDGLWWLFTVVLIVIGIIIAPPILFFVSAIQVMFKDPSNAGDWMIVLIVSALLTAIEVGLVAYYFDQNEKKKDQKEMEIMAKREEERREKLILKPVIPTLTAAERDGLRTLNAELRQGLDDIDELNEMAIKQEEEK